MGLEIKGGLGIPMKDGSVDVRYEEGKVELWSGILGDDINVLWKFLTDKNVDGGKVRVNLTEMNSNNCHLEVEGVKVCFDDELLRHHSNRMKAWVELSLDTGQTMGMVSNRNKDIRTVITGLPAVRREQLIPGEDRLNLH